MRAINILNNSVESTISKEIRARLQKFGANDGTMDRLLKEIKDGNTQLIDDLLASAEEIILKVMVTMPESSYSIDERLTHVTTVLRKLALTAVDHPSRQLFERFCAFQAKQSLLALEAGDFGK